jgi:hypothetical protein
MVRDLSVVPLPPAGRGQGWGMFGPDIGANRHPLPASPVEGEVRLGACGNMVVFDV